jgi:hypothetical protein
VGILAVLVVANGPLYALAPSSRNSQQYARGVDALKQKINKLAVPVRAEYALGWAVGQHGSKFKISAYKII